MGKDKYLQKDTCIIDDSLHISVGPAEPETPFIKRSTTMGGESLSVCSIKKR